MCGNEESTKYFLVLPVLTLLGYNPADPQEVYPEYPAGFENGDDRRVDLAILRGGEPVIAIECKKVNADLASERGQLRAYFNALLPVKVGILTNGILFEFFVDADEPNMMDSDPFLTIDLETIARTGVTDEVLEACLTLTKEHFDGPNVAEAAHVQLIKKRLRTIFVDEARSPSEPLCRLVLERAGLRYVKKAAIDRYYGPMIKNAFEESLVVPVVAMLRQQSEQGSLATADSVELAAPKIATTERELAIYKYVRRRLAFLVDDELQFDAIEYVHYKDYIGKLSIFYHKTNKGRLFDFIEGVDGYDKFIFPDPIGEIVTNSVRDIDRALKATFIARVRELGGIRTAAEEGLRYAG